MSPVPPAQRQCCPPMRKTAGMFNSLRGRRSSTSSAGPGQVRGPATRPAPPVRGAAGRGRIRRFFGRRRRLLAGTAVAAAAGITVQALLPADPATAPAVSAAADLPAGHLLTSRDLKVIRLPPEGVPPGALSEAALADGQVLAVPVLGGTVISSTVLVGDGMLTGAPEGTAAVPLRPADPAAAALLSPGVRVNVVLAPEQGFDSAGDPQILAAGVPVLWVTRNPGADSPWPGAASGEGQEQLVVVAASEVDAARLAVASVQGGVYLVPASR